MSSPTVSVQVFDGFASRVSAPWLRRIAERTLAVGEARAGASVSVLVANDELVRELNAKHRGLDENTDVLSFSFDRQGEYYGEREPQTGPDEDIDFALPPGDGHSMGEVVISFPQAHRQAARAGHSVDRELAVLLVHGVLHLMGHDHEEPEEKAAMNMVEAGVLEMVWAQERTARR